LSRNIFKKLKKQASKLIPVRIKSPIISLLKRGGVSTDYEMIDETSLMDSSDGWKDSDVAEWQYRSFIPLLKQMHEGEPREDFLALAEAVRRTELSHPCIIEVGCGSGWNHEVLGHLVSTPHTYVGLDYSSPMISIAKQHYPDVHFCIGDATGLPFKDESCDILLSGTVLMHLLDYRDAIQECKRVTRQTVIFHTVPVCQHHKTTILRKKAYGKPTIEIIFNEYELKRLFEEADLVIQYEIDSLPYNLEEVLGEPTTTKTYVCNVRI